MMSQNDARKADLKKVVTMFPHLIMSVKQLEASDGTKVTLGCLIGTVPIIYKGNAYDIPITVFLDDDHPNSAPYCYVSPTKSMVIRKTEHVAANGRISVFYLDEWKSPEYTTVELLKILIAIFESNCPVYSAASEKTTSCKFLLLQKGILLNDNEMNEADVLIADGKIVEIKKHLTFLPNSLNKEDKHIVDVGNCLITSVKNQPDSADVTTGNTDLRKGKIEVGSDANLVVWTRDSSRQVLANACCDKNLDIFAGIANHGIPLYKVQKEKLVCLRQQQNDDKFPYRDLVAELKSKRAGQE